MNSSLGMTIFNPSGKFEVFVVQHSHMPNFFSLRIVVSHNMIYKDLSYLACVKWTNQRVLLCLFPGT